MADPDVLCFVRLDGAVGPVWILADRVLAVTPDGCSCEPYPRSLTHEGCVRLYRAAPAWVEL